MFSLAFILNIVVLGIGGILLLVGILLLGFGIFALIKARRSPVSTPSYSSSVDYPSENGIEKGFDDKPQWADEIVTEARDAANGERDDSEAEPALEADSSFRKIKNGREKSFLVVGGLLVLIGLYMLFNAIALIA